MLATIEFLILFAIIASLLYFQVSRLTWTVLMPVILLVYTWYSRLPLTLMILIWLLYLATALIFNVKFLRLRYLSKPMFNFFRTILPSMSQTEEEALKAGDVWWEAELFRGQPQWSQLHTIPTPELSATEQHFLDHEVQTLCEKLDDWKMTHQDGHLDEETWSLIKQQGFLGMVISKDYGGLGFSPLAHSTIIMKIATRSASAAVSIMVPNSLGPAELLSHYGTDEQKDYYLPRLAKGKEIPCFALTAPQAGSDAASIPDRGIICKGKHAGKEVIGIRLSWNKRYITLAPIATLLGLAFKLYDPDHLVGNVDNIGITLCLIPTNHPGVEIGQRHRPMGLAFMNGPTRGQDVFIPLDWIIGGPDRMGQGWKMLMECLAIGRSISLPALSAAIAKMTYRTTGAYARVRKQFKLPIGKFEGIEEVLGRMGGYTYLIEATRILTADAVSRGIKPSVASAIAKYHMTEMGRTVINDAMDIHAGRAVQLGPRNYLGFAYQSIPISITVEGANILTRNLIIFGQGAIRCHPYVQAEIQAATCSDPAKGLTDFDRALVGHIAYTFRNGARILYYSLTGARLIKPGPAKSPLRKYYQQLTRMSAALAFVSDITMLVLGGNLKRKERLSARLGDVLSHLYLASAVVKYFADQNYPKADLPHVHYALQTCLQRIQIALNEFFANFPITWLGKMMRIFIFPFGRAYQCPADTLGHQISQAMLSQSETRERLTQDCFIGKSDDDPIGRIEQAFSKILASNEFEIKLQQALKDGKIDSTLNIADQIEQAVKHKILTKTQAKKLSEALAAATDAIQVDDFS